MTARYFKFEYGGETLYLKFDIRKQSSFLVKVQHFIMRLIDRPILNSTHNQEGVAEEKARLEIFRDKGVYVPKVHGFYSYYMIVSDIGEDLNIFLKRLPSSEERYPWVARAVQALPEMHALGLCHSRPILRDITYDASCDRIGFIDLEENAPAVMPLATAMARDRFLFLCSAGRYLDDAHLEKIMQQFNWQDPRMDMKALRGLVRMIHPAARLFLALFHKRQSNEIAAAARATHLLSGLFKTLKA